MSRENTSCIIASGTLTVTIDGAFVCELKRGESFGEIALLEDIPRTASVTASETARSIVLNGRRLWLP